MTRTNARRIVVGDIHGELQGLKEILLHAGIIDRGQSWVGGDTVLVQTGDVIDRGPDSHGAVALLRKLQQEAPASSGCVVRCCGNHELMLLQDNHGYVNFSDADGLAAALRQEIAQGALLAAYTDGTRFYTHAGVRTVVRQHLVEEMRATRPSMAGAGVELEDLARHINDTFKSAIEQRRCDSRDHCLFWVDRVRGGRNDVGGIFWGDYSCLVSSERAWDIPQVFGHTPTGSPDLEHAHGLKLIDVDGGMCEFYGGGRVYLEITAGDEIVQHGKVGSRWRRKVLAAGDFVEVGA